MKVSIIVATHGDEDWARLAANHAMPSAKTQGAFEVFSLHVFDATLASVRNLAAMEASGDWLCFLDADDQLAPGYVEAMRVADADEFDFHCERWPGQAYGVRLFVPAVQYVKRGVDLDDPVIPSWGRPLIDVNCAVIGTLISRSVFVRLHGFRELPMYEDWDLWLRAVVDGAKLVPVPRAVYRADAGEGRNTQPLLEAETYWRIRNEYEVAYRAATG